MDSTSIRSREEGERHLEVRVGNVETVSEGRQVFDAVAKAHTDLSMLIRQSLRAVGRTDDTKVTAFTDGCPGLRSILVDAGIATPPIRKVMHVYKDERGQHTRSAPSRRLWHAPLDVDRYLKGQSSWLVNYAKRYRAGLRVGTSITEGTANFLVNRRMNKSQQMCWSRRGADLLLQVRCAVYNGTLGSELGHRFQLPANQNQQFADAA